MLLPVSDDAILCSIYDLMPTQAVRPALNSSFDRIHEFSHAMKSIRLLPAPVKGDRNQKRLVPLCHPANIMRHVLCRTVGRKERGPEFHSLEDCRAAAEADGMNRLRPSAEDR